MTRDTESPRRDRRARMIAMASMACVGGIALGSDVARGGDYRVERIAAGLTQPNYLTQAPGDPANVVYYVERTQAPADGSYNVSNFSKVNHMGKVIRYDMASGAKTTVLDMYDRKVFQDDGLQHVSFAPDFQTTGKIYVTSSTYTGTQAFGSNGSGTQPVPTNRVEEYTVNPTNPSAATTTLSRTILSYTNNVMNNHTIDGAWFDPTATGAATKLSLYQHRRRRVREFLQQRRASPRTAGRARIRAARSKARFSASTSAVRRCLSERQRTRTLRSPVIQPICPTYNAAHPQTAQIAGNGESLHHRHAQRVSHQLRPRQRQHVHGRRR